MKDAAFVEMILKKFQRSMQNDFDSLAQSVRDKDVPDSLQKAHSLKGAAANAGADQLKQLATGLEDVVRQADFQLAERCLAELGRELDRCLCYIPRACQELGKTRL